MTVIFDLDYTLMDTARFKEALAASLKDCGVSVEDFWETYEQVSKTVDKICDYDPARHAEALKDRMTCSQPKMLERIDVIVGSARGFLFPGAIPMLKRLRGDGHTLVLFTHGNAAWQEKKVAGAGLAGFFDRLIFAPENKEKYVVELKKLNPPVVFVNDHGGEIDALRKAMPEARFIAVRGPKPPPADPAVPVCEDLDEVYRAIVTSDIMMKTRIVILAAGKGKRMGSLDMPKVLRPLLGKPLLKYVLDAVRASGVDPRPVVVVGFLADQVKAVCGSACDYALQERLLGTGDAVRATRPLVGEKAEHVLVLNGDHPLVSGPLIRRIAETHLTSGSTLTLGTVMVDDFEGWRKPFVDFGRVIRDEAGKVMGIVEVKDARPAELDVRELNPNILCFKASWLWPNLETLTTENAQGEYYVTSLIARAIETGEPVTTVPVAPEEAVGVNTPEQLALAEGLMKT